MSNRKWLACTLASLALAPLSAQRVTVQAKVNGANQNIGRMILQPRANGRMYTEFFFDRANFGWLEAWYDFRWINVITNYTVDGVAQTYDPVVGYLPAIDPGPRDGVEPFYYNATEWRAAGYNAREVGVITAKAEGVRSSFVDAPGCPLDSVITFKTFLVARDVTGGGFPNKTCYVLHGFTWQYHSRADKVRGVAAIPADAAAVNAALGNNNALAQANLPNGRPNPGRPGFTDWTASTTLNMVACKVVASGATPALELDKTPIKTTPGNRVTYTVQGAKGPGSTATNVTIHSLQVQRSSSCFGNFRNVATPAGVTHSNALPVTGVGTASTGMGWTPGPADVGAWKFIYRVQDDQGEWSTWTIKIVVERPARKAPMVPPTPLGPPMPRPEFDPRQMSVTPPGHVPPNPQLQTLAQLQLVPGDDLPQGQLYLLGSAVQVGRTDLDLISGVIDMRTGQFFANDWVQALNGPGDDFACSMGDDLRTLVWSAGGSNPVTGVPQVMLANRQDVVVPFGAAPTDPPLPIQGLPVGGLMDVHFGYVRGVPTVLWAEQGALWASTLDRATGLIHEVRTLIRGPLDPAGIDLHSPTFVNDAHGEGQGLVFGERVLRNGVLESDGWFLPSLDDREAPHRIVSAGYVSNPAVVGGSIFWPHGNGGPPVDVIETPITALMASTLDAEGGHRQVQGVVPANFDPAALSLCALAIGDLVPVYGVPGVLGDLVVNPWITPITLVPDPILGHVEWEVILPPLVPVDIEMQMLTLVGSPPIVVTTNNASFVIE